MGKVVARKLTVAEMEAKLEQLEDRLEDVQDSLNVAKAKVNKMNRRIERARAEESKPKPPAAGGSVKK